MSDVLDPHAEIEDEYQIGLEAGVEDETAEESSSASFTINSYGADYPVDTLVQRMEKEAFYIPHFQRNFVWSQRHASRFIESLLMGLPVPGIFLYKDAASGRHLVVDGQQRLRTLQYFYDGVFLDKAFKLIGVQREWEGRSYKELAANEQRRLDDSILHATVFQQEQPKNTQRSLYFVFERINSGGIRLSPQEIRNCISEGPALSAVRHLNDDPNWRAIFGVKKNNRLKDQELVLRALAMISNRTNYAPPMRDFLNAFASNEDAKVSEAELAMFGDLFRNVMQVINESKGKTAFRPAGVLNAAVFEAVAVGIAERFVKMPEQPPIAAKVTEAYDRLVANSGFMDACGSATATVEKVDLRQKLAIEAFAST